ncbi:MAG: hypothetical protein Q9163_005531 [Psora crenata]
MRVKCELKANGTCKRCFKRDFNCTMPSTLDKERNMQREAKNRAEGSNSTEVWPSQIVQQQQLSAYGEEGGHAEGNMTRESTRKNRNLRDIPPKSYFFADSDRDVEMSGPMVSAEDADAAKAEQMIIEAAAARLVAEAANAGANEDGLNILAKQQNSHPAVLKKQMLRLLPPEAKICNNGHFSPNSGPNESSRTGRARQQANASPRQNDANSATGRTAGRGVNVNRPTQSAGLTVTASASRANVNMAAQSAHPMPRPMVTIVRPSKLSTFQAMNTHLQVRRADKPGFHPLRFYDCLTCPSFLDNIVAAWRMPISRVSEIHIIYSWLPDTDPSRYVVFGHQEFIHIKGLIEDDISDMEFWEYTNSCLVYVILVSA